MNIEFPKTNLVKCEFRYSNGSDIDCTTSINQYGERTGGKFKSYTYKLLPGVEVQPGDAVVVYGTTGFQICQVMSVNATTSNMNATGLVISKFDMAAFQLYIDKQNEMAELQRLIEAKKCELEKTLTYDILAEKSPEFAAMLKLFRDNGGKLC